MRWFLPLPLILLLGCPTASVCEGECVPIPEGEAIRIGTALVMTGELGDVGEQGARAVELALEQQVELAGFPLEVVKEDSACTAAGGLSAMEVLEPRPRLVGIVGPSCSSAAKAILDEGAPARPLVSPSNTSPVLTRPDFHLPGYFRVAPSDGQQGERMAGHAAGPLGLTTAAVVFDGSEYMEAIGQDFGLAFEDDGGELVAFEEAGDDLEPLVEVLAGAAPELVYLLLSPYTAGEVAAALRAAPVLADVQLAGLDQLDAPAFLDVEAAEGTLLTRFAWYHAGAGYESFVAAWEERWDDTPDALFCAHAWDATQLLLTGLQEATELAPSGDLHVDLSELVAALHATDTLPALTGVLGCDEYGDCAAPTPIDLRVVVDGETVPAPVP